MISMSSSSFFFGIKFGVDIVKKNLLNIRLNTDCIDENNEILPPNNAKISM